MSDRGTGRDSVGVVRRIDGAVATTTTTQQQSYSNGQYLAKVIREENANIPEAAYHYTEFLKALGVWDIMDEEPKLRTPARVVHAYLEFFGNNLEPINFTTFDVPECSKDSWDIVSVYDIEFSSLCAHHHLPFTGVCHIGYLPCKKVAGLSKLPRTVEHLTHGALIQEDVTRCIADYLYKALECHGVVVVMEAEHSCMATRGVRKPGHTARTITTRGVFAETGGEARLQAFLGRIK